MKTSSFPILMAAMSILLMAGCKPSVVGKWSLDTTLGGMPIRGTVEYKKDQTFVLQSVLTIRGQQLPVSISGTWRLETKEGKTLLIQETTKATVAGQDVPRSMLGSATTTSEVTFGKDGFTTKDVESPHTVVTYTRTK